MFICGGAFTGIEKIIAERLHKQEDDSVGFIYTKSHEEREQSITYNEMIDHILPEDIKNFGLITELLGRLQVLCPLKELTQEDLERILTEPKNAIIKQVKELVGMYGVDLSFTKDTIPLIAKLAYERKTGARALRSIVENLIDDKIFDIKDDTKKIRITKKDIEDKFKYYMDESKCS